jgi:hypothetical protein
MFQNQDMRSKYLQACSFVQNQGFCKKLAKKGRKNDLLGNRSNKKKLQPLTNLIQNLY